MTKTERTMWIVLVSVMIGVACLFIFTHVFQREEPSSPLMEEETLPAGLASYGALPAFSLMTEEGNEFTLHDLQGHVWIANFIFSRRQQCFSG